MGTIAPVMAQPTRSFTIQDGKVWIDNQEVPADRLPESLQVDGVQVSYNWVGHDAPQFTFNKVIYTLDDGTLREVADLREEQGGVMVFFRNGSYAPYRTGEADFAVARGQNENTVVQLQNSARALHAYSAELAQLSEDEAAAHNAHVIRQARDKAQAAAEVAQTLPLIEVQSYLADVQRQNRTLYELLVQEWQMEAEAQALALDIRRMESSADRDTHVDRLRQLLDTIFELKQENRRREIRQLEAEMEELRARLQKREDYRERMIEQRLQELIAFPLNR
ncbi:MAG TPA: hypothetical protein VKP65_03475 [Rhodothermales bacterium]|nr:hypothetical protein [Rhodothermales bacterium]